MKEQREEKINLAEILYKIKIENNDSYYYELSKNEKVLGLIWSVVKKYRSNQHLIKSYALSALYDLTLNDYRYQSEYTEANYVSFIDTCLNRRVAEVVERDKFLNNYGYEEFEENNICYFNNNEFNQEFNDLIKCLNDREKQIIIKIYQEQYTERELENEFGITHQAINKIKQKSLKIIKKNIKNGCQK